MSGSLRLSREELAAMLRSNPGLRVATEALERAPVLRETIAPPESRRNPAEPPPVDGDFIARLMQVPAWHGSWEGEEYLSVACAAELRRLTLEGRLRCVWSRVPVEHEAGGRIGRMHQAKRTVMGVVPGAPDFVFVWGSGSGLIELKVADAQGRIAFIDAEARTRRGRRSYLRPRQRDFRAWAEGHGVKHAVARSVTEMLAALKGWGVLDA